MSLNKSYLILVIISIHVPERHQLNASYLLVTVKNTMSSTSTKWNWTVPWHKVKRLERVWYPVSVNYGNYSSGITKCIVFHDYYGYRWFFCCYCCYIYYAHIMSNYMISYQIAIVNAKRSATLHVFRNWYPDSNRVETNRMSSRIQTMPNLL